ncbi:HNH endonuclease [Bradyrhizobium sp. 160]|uniref:HNH endonuclease family protein n=1 Tax=Bradyrhizobium sp. 160 TaxID=2782634 RepID=UPI001FF7289E|nr:HNH endonuclease family protein [Bradyrhizobium sp. 160]MCK1626316.1 HNH endonuclease [Bradyrhizobium sp. 160]
MLIRKSSINDRIEKFSRLTKEVESGDDLASEKSALQLSQAEPAATFKVLSGPLYDTLAARARSAVLLRLDALMSGGGASYDYDTITVEHVMPQNPKADSKWIEWFPDAQKRLDIVHSLGNLALLTGKKNASASNWEFDRKKKAYFAKDGVSPFVLTTQVLEHNDWTPSIVPLAKSSFAISSRRIGVCKTVKRLDPLELNRRRVDVDPTSLTPKLSREGKAFPCGRACSLGRPLLRGRIPQRPIRVRGRTGFAVTG